jgi:hypothetical protein
MEDVQNPSNSNVEIFGNWDEDDVKSGTFDLGSRTVGMICRGSGEFRATLVLLSDSIPRDITYYPLGNLTS